MAYEQPCNVVYDPDALRDLLDGVQSRSERKAVHHVVDKLQQVGPTLGPPHMKPLRGLPGLSELRPRRGDSSTRLLYRRFDRTYVILAIAKDKGDLPGKARAGQQRGRRYER